jgi:hypothetical protein
MSELPHDGQPPGAVAPPAAAAVPAPRSAAQRAPTMASIGERVGGPVSRAWREGTLTRAQELENLTAWARDNGPRPNSDPLFTAIRLHLHAAREAALPPRRWFADEARLERAMSNLDAAEALLLDVAAAEYVLGRLPGVLNDVVRHLSPTDPRRQRVELIAQQAGVSGRPAAAPAARDAEERLRRATAELAVQLDVADRHRQEIAAAARAASSGAMREQLRVRSFRGVLLATTALLMLLAAGLLAVGLISPTTLPLCFEPERAGQTVVVCPTAQSTLLPTGAQSGPASEDVDDAVGRTAQPVDMLVVELVGLAAAAGPAAAAIRGIRGSSEPHGLPVALALLKLPTGALTAVLGLLLMRGQFIPGLTALDSSAQIIGWALVFGYAQQLFTRLVDQQAHTVLDAVRGGGDRARARPADPAR